MWQKVDSAGPDLYEVFDDDTYETYVYLIFTELDQDARERIVRQVCRELNVSDSYGINFERS